MNILQAFVNITRDKEFSCNLNNIHNPIYGILAQELKMPMHKIRKVISRMQPSLIVQKYLPDSKSYMFETSMHHAEYLNMSRKSSDGSATTR